MSKPPKLGQAQKATIAALLCLVLVIGVSVGQSSRQPPSNQHSPANAQNSGPTQTADKSPNITDWLLVLFSGLLFGSNVFLWGVTRTAANAAKKSADAASVSAEAISVVERAYVYPIIIATAGIEDCINAAIDSKEFDAPAPMTGELVFELKNFGKTPAILKSAFVAFGVPPLGALIGVSIPKSVLAPLKKTGRLISVMQKGITRNQAQHILVYTGHLGFEGAVTFDDIWGNEHTTEFYFVWDKDIRRMRLTWAKTKTKQKGEEDMDDTVPDMGSTE